MPRPTVARINLDALVANVRALKGLIGPRKVCAAVKADAYGHGAPVVCHALSQAGVDMFGVAMTEEAVDLRQAGIREPIVLLTVVPSDDIPALLKFDVSPCIAHEGFARDLSAGAVRAGQEATAHINIDTGMHRVGLDWQSAAAAILRISRLDGLRVTGIFSHFARSDADDLSFSHRQVRRLRCVLSQLRRAGMELPTIHMSNSNGVLRIPGAYFDGVRPGLMLYGLYSRPELRSVVELEPVLSMRTRVGHCMRLGEGEKVGYGHTFTTWRDSVIATLPIGYHDGYLRQFSNTGEVIVRGKRVPVVGRVCMDQTLVDVTDVPDVQIGDDVTIYGEDGGECISVEEMAARVDRIPYELTCSVGPRVRREFVYNGAVVIETPFRSVVPTGSLQEQAFGVTAAGDEPPDKEADRRGVA